MQSLRRIALWATLIGIVLWTALSIVGAFMGDQRAGRMFSSPPMAVFWIVFTALFIVGLLAFPRLRRSPGLLALHVGTALILGGVALVASQMG